MYEILPGFLLNLLVAVVVSLAQRTDEPGIGEEFDRMERDLARDRGDIDLTAAP